MAQSAEQKRTYQSDLDEAVRLVKEHGTVTKAALASGIADATLRSRIKSVAIRNRSTPLSEADDKFRELWGEIECIAELRRIAKIDTDRVVTRNYFRTHAECSESTWNRYFGTFEEYKRQAGITLTRQQHQHERNIAKQASVDHYRVLNHDRREYAESYLKPTGNRWQTILRGSDFHDIECDPFFLSVFLATAKRVQPNVIVLNGDIFDLPEFGRYDVDPREWDVSGRIRFVHENILAPLREACPDAQIDLIEGNHEMRLVRHLADATPAMKAVLSDLHGFTVATLLGLDRYEVNYIAKCDLGTYTAGDLNKELRENQKVYFNSVLAHHFPEGRNLGVPGFNGHHHKFKVWDMYSIDRGSYNWVQSGCGHTRDATYCDGQKWQNEFGLVLVDSEKRHVQHECFVFSPSFVSVGGRLYQRPLATVKILVPA